MKMRKKVVGLALAGVLLLAGCGASQQTFATVNGKKSANKSMIRSSISIRA